MRKIYAIGETVLDIIFKDNKPITATPGGSILNTVVSLGRLDMDIYFITEFGEDRVGDIVTSFLHKNGVNTDFVYRYPVNPSSLALAFLDDHNNASYSFYKHYPDKRLDIEFPEPTSEDIIIFGSYYAIDHKVHNSIKFFIDKAYQNECLILYDPNIRPVYMQEREGYKPVIMENISYADIIKASDEDLTNLFGNKNIDDSYLSVKNACELLICTANKFDVCFYMCGRKRKYPVPSIVPVSTVGAGDNFNAGLIYSIVRQNIYKKDVKKMTVEQQDEMIQTAIKFSGHVCMNYENYISPDFAASLKK